MTAFELRAATKDLQQQSEVVIENEKGERFEAVKVEHQCNQRHDEKSGEMVDCYPKHLVIVIRKLTPDPVPEKKGGVYTKGSGV